MPRRSFHFAGSIALALLATACRTDDPTVMVPSPTPPVETTAAGDPPDQDPPTEAATAEAGPLELTVTVIAEGIEAPWDVAFAPGGAIYLSERERGTISLLGEDGRYEPFARLQVDPAGEGGLLGLATDGDGELYAYLSTTQDNRIVRVGGDGDPEPILTGIPKASNHNGGRIAFGPDGMLYATTGDAAQPGSAQDPASLAGKILRMTADGQIPPDNPDPGSLVYSLGHRNVQGLAWTADGQLYATEFGPDADDEINRIEPGANYGWPEATGQAGHASFADPVFVRQPAEASWSGAAILNGGAIPQWEGSLFAAGLRGTRLWRLELGPGGQVSGHEELLVGEFGRLRHVAQAPDGSLWILTSNRDGRGKPAPADDRILRLGPAR